MSSKFIFLILIFMFGCGVKGDPKAPQTANLPSVLDDYPDIQSEQPLNDFKKSR